MTQTDQILAHLQSGKSITPIDALNLFGCFRLGARILELRKEGFDIETEMIHENGKTFAKYYLNQTTPDAYKVQGELLSA